MKEFECKDLSDYHRAGSEKEVNTPAAGDGLLPRLDSLVRVRDT